MTNLSPETVMLLRSIKKSAVILICMGLLDRPVGSGELARILAISPNTAAKYLDEGVRLGMITRTHHQKGYLLTDYGRQMILSNPVENPVDMLPEGQVITDENLKNCAFEATTTTIKYKNGKENRERVVVVEDDKHAKFEYLRAFQLLVDAGIGEPVRSRLLDLEWMTPDYIQAHIEFADKHAIDTALLIHRMRVHDPAPKRSSYTDGPYSDFIQH